MNDQWNGKSLDENLRGMSSRVKQDDKIVIQNECSASHLPINQINCQNVREYLSSIENAQKKWLESAKSWPVKDEVQSAQIKWLTDLKVSGSKYITSTPEPKKKPRPYSLPFSPPRSSADVDPRRGVCIYKPGVKSSHPTVREFINERGYSVKVARIEEPETVHPIRQPQKECQVKSPRNELSKQQLVCGFQGSDDRSKTSGKRFITVRKKLERLKPEEIRAINERQKPSISPETRQDEKREATRDYILRKRAQREREIEEARKQEARAHEEKNARMQRLKETQQRLIRSALRRQSQVTQSNEQCFEGNASSNNLPEHDDCSHVWSPKIVRATPPKRKSLPNPSQNDWTTSEMRPPENAVIGLQPPIAELLVDRDFTIEDPLTDLLLNKDVSTKQVLEFINDACKPRPVSSVTKTEVIHTVKCTSVVSSSEASKTFGTSVNPLCHLSSKQLTDTFQNSIPSHSKPLPIISPKPSTSFAQDYEKNEERYTHKSCSESSLSSSSKENHKNQEQNVPYHKTKRYKDLLEISPTLADIMGHPYSLRMAVQNKHAAVQQMKKDLLKDSRNENKSSEAVNEKSSERKAAQRKLKDISEKSVQCSGVEHGETGSLPQSGLKNRQGSFSLDSSEIHITKRDRISDNYLYDAHIQDTKGNEQLFEQLHPSKFDFANCSYKSLNSETPINGKGRPTVEMPNTNNVNCDLPVDPLEVPRELNLLPRISDINIGNENKFTDNESEFINNARILESSTINFFNTPPSIISNSAVHETTVDNADSCNELVKARAFKDPISDKAHDCRRDSRIEDEIKKLDYFNDSISSVIEKNKTVLAHDTDGKSTYDEDLILEKIKMPTPSTSLTNNDTLLEMSQNTTLRGSQSFSSFDIPSEDISGASIAKFSLHMFNEILKDEDLRSAHQTSLFKMRESTITEKAKAEIAFLDLEKKKLKEAGNEEGIRNIRKKIRGLIIRLEHDLEELHKARKLEKNAYRKRRQRLVEKINMIKVQLKTQLDLQNKSQKNVSSTTNSRTELKKTHINERRGSEVHSFLDSKKKELEHRELALTERLAELENISSWKHRLEEGEKRIQDLEACLKVPSTQGDHKESENVRLVERGTSPFRLASDESQGERQKAEGSYSDTFDQASSSSTHERLVGKDVRKMMAIKAPLSPRVTLKRRHSSGSDESLLFSQTETQSDASDMEVRVLALQQQLKQRKTKLESLHREYKKSQRERLIAKEQSLLSQIQAYDLYIDQVRKELDKEREGNNVKVVKPLIKQPKPVSERRKSDTWLIQDKDKCSSLVINSSAGCLASPTKEIKKREYDFNLDTKSLEKLSLRSKLSSKNSFSDPNLLESGTLKISHSLTESCESDVEKVKLVFVDSTNKGKNIPHSLSLEKSKSHILSKDSLTDKSTPLPLCESNRNDSFENYAPISIPDQVEQEKSKSDYTEPISQDKDIDSEENISTQMSMVSKTNKTVINDENSCEIDGSTVINKKEDKVSKEIEGSCSATNSHSITEVGFSQDKSESVKLESGIEESKYLVNNYNETTSHLLEIDVPGSIMPSFEDTCSDAAILKNKGFIEEVSHIKADLNNGGRDARNRILYSKSQVEHLLSKEQAIDEIKDNSLNSTNEVSDISILKENTELSNQSFLINVLENSEMINEESVREVTYLEVSDHAITPSVPNEDSELSIKEVSEESNVAGLNLCTSTAVELEQKITSVINDQLSFENVPQNILQEKNATFHSLSEVEEQLSRNTSDDLSGDYFPLPITKKVNSVDVVESIEEKVTSVVDTEIEAKDMGEIKESDTTELIISEQEHSYKESFISEIVSLEQNLHNESIVSEVMSLAQGNSSKESATAMELSSNRDNSNKKSEILDQEKSNSESVISEEFSLIEGKSCNGSEMHSLNQKNSSKESLISEVLSLAQLKSNEDSSISESLSVQHEQSNNEYLISELVTAENVNKASIVSETHSLVQDNTVIESVISEVPSSVRDSSNKESIITEVLSLAQDDSNKGSEFSVAEDVNIKILNEAEIPVSESSKVSSSNDIQSGESLEVSEENSLQPAQSEISESVKKPSDELKLLESPKSNGEDGFSEIAEEDRSFSEIYEQEGAKSSFDESNLDDSLGDHDAFLRNLKLKTNFFENEEEYASGSDDGDSYIGDRLTDEDVYNLKTPLKQPQQMWTEETDLKGPGAPLIEALQREGGSALDVVWRRIAEEAVDEASELVISTFIKKSMQQDVDCKDLLQLEQKKVGDNDEDEWQREKLSQEQAEREAEILRLQQLRIDKEIEELEEEEARQYYYVRAIPDKPPPPYTPRRSSLVSSVVEAAGEIWSGQTSIPPSFMPGLHLREFLWDLAAELVLRVNPPSPPMMPPWVRSKRHRPKKPIRTKDQLLEEVEKEAKIFLGVEERKVRENLIIRWSRKRRDHVDEILVRESQEEEWEWTDFTEEENIIKNRISETLIEEAVSSATDAIAQAFEKKFNSNI